jgi:hypothetical protein
MPRTDVHRPSAINPADYRFVAFDYLRQVDADDAPVDLSGCTWLQAEHESLRQDMVRSGGAWSDHAHGGNCMVCGNANAIYTAAFHHAPTNSYVRMGSDCSRNVNASLDHDAFMRFRNRVSSWLQRDNRVALAVAALARRGLGQLAQFCGATEVLATDHTQRTISDIVYRLMQNGSLSERQWNYLSVLRERWLNPSPTTHRANMFAGTCTRCAQQVAANAGAIERVEGRWTVHHLDGQCPAPAPAAPANNIGELGGVMALFERARAHLQRPAVVLDAAGVAHPIRITVAGASSNHPGQLYVLSENPYRTGRRAFFGRVDLEGNYHPSRYTGADLNESIVARLRHFAEAPAEVAGEYGRLHGRCCFCRLPLTDARSTAVGYGQVCAGHYGLPWGERPAAFAAPVASTGGVVPRQQATISRAMQQAARPDNWFQLVERQRGPTTPTPPSPMPPDPPPVPRRAVQQLDLNFDAAAEHARRANSGQECPACEGIVISTAGNQWRCHGCGVKWTKQETN